jgi:hypothetical protein
MKACEGKKTCLVFMCNATLILMELPMEDNATTFMMELHLKELEGVVFATYKEVKIELNDNICVVHFYFFYFIFSVTLIVVSESDSE